MDKFLVDAIKSVIPKLNPDIASGLATKLMPEAERYLEARILALEPDFIPGLKYVNITRATPEEVFAALPRLQQDRPSYDIARSSLYMININFQYKGIPISARTNVPYVGLAGTLWLSGTRYVVTPVLADRVLSITPNDVFVKFDRDKVTIERIARPVNFLASETHFEDLRLVAVHVLHTPIYKKDARQKMGGPRRRIPKAQTSLVHLLLCKYGFTEAFQRFTGCVPRVMRASAFNPSEYDPEEWVLCRPHHLGGRASGYYQTDMMMLVPRAGYNDLMRQFIAGYFYLCLYFGDRILPEYLDHLDGWLVLLGLINCGYDVPEGMLLSKMETHISSLDMYVDEEMRIKFSEINIPVQDIYQFFTEVMLRFNDWVNGAGESSSSMYDKELSILPYVLSPITHALTTFYYRLKNRSNSNTKPLNANEDPAVTARDIENQLTSLVRPGVIHEINSGSDHAFVSTISYPGDNMVLKITSMLVPQRSTTGGRRKETGDGSNQMHFSKLEVGMVRVPGKNDPTCWSKINPYVRTSSRDLIIRNPELDQIREETQPYLKRN